MRLKTVAPKFFLPALLSILLSALLWGCVTSAEDNGKYSGTLGEKNLDYQLDTLVVDECQTQAYDTLSAFDPEECVGCDSAQMVTAVKAAVMASFGSGCKETGGTRDTLFVAYIDYTGLGGDFLLIDRENYDAIVSGYYANDTVGEYVAIGEIPYRTHATTQIEQNLASDNFIVKTPSLTEESEVTAECYSEAELTPGYKQWWPADFTAYPDLKEVDLTPGGGICELGDKYRITIK